MADKPITDEEVYFSLLDAFSTSCGETIEISILDRRYELAYQVVKLRHRLCEVATYKKIGNNYCCSECGSLVPVDVSEDFDFCPYCGQVIRIAADNDNEDKEKIEPDYTEPIEKIKTDDEEK